VLDGSSYRTNNIVFVWFFSINIFALWLFLFALWLFLLPFGFFIFFEEAIFLGNF
jgi:hypothetical protein